MFGLVTSREILAVAMPGFPSWLFRGRGPRQLHPRVAGGTVDQVPPCCRSVLGLVGGRCQPDVCAMWARCLCDVDKNRNVTGHSRHKATT